MKARPTTPDPRGGSYPNPHDRYREQHYHEQQQYNPYQQDGNMYGHEADSSMYGYEQSQPAFPMQMGMTDNGQMQFADPYQQQQPQAMDPQQQYEQQQLGYNPQDQYYPAQDQYGYGGYGDPGHMGQQQQQQQPDQGNSNNSAEYSMHRESNSMTIHEISDILNNMAPSDDYFQAICEHLTRNPNGLPTAATTLMIRNVPQRYTHYELLQDIVTQGFEKYVDFLYLPTDSRGHQNVGYAFLNFVSVDHLLDFKRLLHDDMLQQHRVTTPLVAIPSTTQGWRENVLKVIKNVVLKKQVPNEQLPLLFCKSSGEQFPFPVPQEQQFQQQSQSQPSQPSGARLRRRSLSPPPSEYSGYQLQPVSLANEFDNSPASRGSSRRSIPSNHSKCSSWESQKTLVEKDPLEALAPDASGRDALVPELRKQKEEHYREASRFNSSSYENLSEYLTPENRKTKNNFLDALCSVGGNRTHNPVSTMGRYSRVARSEGVSSKANSEVCNSELRRSTLPTKASDFFKHFGLECREAPHLKHIQKIRNQENCTLKEKGPPPKKKMARMAFKPLKPKLRYDNTTFYPSAAASSSTQHAVKSPSSKAAAEALKAAIMGKCREISDEKLSDSAKDEFCSVDVEKTFQRQWSSTLESRMSGVADSESPSSHFKTDLFSEPDSSLQSQHLWTSASHNLEAMLDAMANGDDDESSCAEREDDSLPLFARSASSNHTASQLDPLFDRRQSSLDSKVVVPVVEEESTKAD